MESDKHSSAKPPKWPTRLLQWFLKEELLEEVTGDLMEQYTHLAEDQGARQANITYWIQVLNYIRPFAMKNINVLPSNPFLMWRHNFKISCRTLVRDKGFSLLNIGGLALGMTVALLISLWIWDELSFNKNHLHYNSIAQVMRHQNSKGDRFTSQYHPSALGKLLKDDYKDLFENVVMVRQTEEWIISFGDRHFSELGNYMQAEAPEMFSLNMVDGNINGLQDLNSIIISQSLADKLFDDGNPINQVIQINGAIDVKVTGVYKDLPRNSEFWETQYISPLALYFSMTGSDPNIWDNYNMHVYTQLSPKSAMSVASEAIKDDLKNHMQSEQAAIRDPALFLHPMKNWHLYGAFEQGQYATSAQMKMLWTNCIIGFFVLFLACINFVNLSTARSEKRSKEIGIRKSIGSTRYQLFHQFISESTIVALAAFGLSLIILVLILPWFNGLSGKTLQLPFGSASFWISGLGFALLTGFLAGSYPALFLSSLQPIQSLKGAIISGATAITSRKVLVVFQFTISIALIIGTLIIYQHIQHAQSRPIGYSQDGLLMLPKRVGALYGRYDVFKEELKKSGAVEEVANADYPLTTTRGNNDGFEWPGKDPSFDPSFNTIRINHEYGSTVRWELISGRDFSKAMSSDINGVIISKSAQQIMQLEDPIGETLRYARGDTDVSDYTILGVVNDLVKESPFQSTMPAIMFLSDRELPWLFVRLNPLITTSEALRKIENVFKSLTPNAPFDFKFVDLEYEAKFRSELRIGELATFFSVLAILISCLGVFGLAAFFAERRTKEIGIRKILGASTMQLWHLQSKDFAVLVLISSAIAIPIAWYFLNGWLATYEYRPHITWWIFAAAGLGTLGITLLTVSYQAIKVALVPPTNSLRTE